MTVINDIYEQIISIDNLKKAAFKASKDKRHRHAVQRFFAENEEDKLLKDLHQSLKYKTFKVGEYTTFITYDPKEREIYKLPFYPDRIVQHAIINILQDYWYSLFRKNTFACILKRGVLGENGLYRYLTSALRSDKKGTVYALKQDIRHYYPSIRHDKIKELLHGQIKDNDALWLLDMQIDSVSTGEEDGVGITVGSILSQYFANIYLTPFDYKMVKYPEVTHYARYNDDKLFLSDNKDRLHSILEKEQQVLRKYGLKLKGNYQIFPVDKRGIDMGGFVFYHDHILMRKRIKYNLLRRINQLVSLDVSIEEFKQGICGWLGYIKYSDSINFCKKNIPEKYLPCVEEYMYHKTSIAA